MAPRFVLLERKVEFVPGSPTGGASEEATEVDIFDPKATEAAVQSMKPDPSSVFEPPEVSRLTMLQLQQMRGVPPGDGLISSTDKALVVLYAGHYRPGCSCSPSSGCYLVYDASTNSVSAVPQIPCSPYFSSLGLGTAILSRGWGSYLLAELGTECDGEGEGTLFLWQCTGPKQQPQSQWDRKSVRLPPQVTDPSFFIDMAFSYADSFFCWVDLLQGVLVCDMLKATEEEPEFTFIPLPHGYSVDDDMEPRPRPEQQRTMSCVNGVIKFVALVGASDNITLESWTLSPDLKKWKLACNPMSVQDLWASMSFRTKNLPKITPVFPTLSVNEDEVVYLSLKEVERKEVHDIYGQSMASRVVTKAHHVLRVDMIKKKVIDCTKITEGTIVTSHWPTMVASEFSSYLHPEGP